MQLLQNVSDYCDSVSFKALLRIDSSPHIKNERSFGKIEYNLTGNPVLATSEIPVLFSSNTSIQSLKKEWKKNGMSVRNLQDFALYQMVDLKLKPVGLLSDISMVGCTSPGCPSSQIVIS